ncbi:hypothetical protein WOLCODRAFT_162717 [Wolfiporia cocos MD-104 SS10]|uniref:NADH dehydrogenase [ubiquinone] 1 alpha subcomplex assembly factor 3 n=1 Tax=Wolfiporia cocos (strain MD-104) TaxID=742152 RepID=A0A2H3JQ94_WOLCO|nr:hypothetical protein WOLCODRAFT_162717 [Wolfiporia cocos MD-104 SS10]
MFARYLAHTLRRQACNTRPRLIHCSHVRRNSDGGLTNILEGGAAPAVQVKTITSEGIQLMDGLIIPSACIFLDGKVFLWDVPDTQWEGWDRKHFQIFDVVVPKPEILLLGTGRKVSFFPPALRQHLNGLGMQVDVMDTWNACSTYNLLTEEGRTVAAALLPLTPRSWKHLPPQ